MTRALLLLLPCLSAQDFKPAEKMPRTRYAYGLPVTRIKDGSKAHALRLVPPGWDLFIVAVNERPIPHITDFEGSQADKKAADCTAIHDNLSAKGPIRLMLVVKKPGAIKGILIDLDVGDWDSGFVYPFKKWPIDPSKVVFTSVTPDVGRELYDQRVSYTDIERRVEVMDLDRAKRDREERKKNPAIGLKDLETFKTMQRRLRIDEGASPKSKEEEAYLDSRRDLVDRYSHEASECKIKKDWAGFVRASIRGSVMDGGLNGVTRDKATLETLKRMLAPVEEDKKGRMRTQASAEAAAALKDKRPLDAAIAATLGRLAGDSDTAKTMAQARRSGFASPEIGKPELDVWLALLGGLEPLAAQLKEGEVYRAEGKVVAAGAFTLVESGPHKWVFEDKAGLKFAEGDIFLLVAVFDGGAPPAGRPEDLAGYPVLRLVMVR